MKLENEFDNVGFTKRSYDDKIINRKYPSGHQISANYEYRENIQIPNYSVWQKIRCKIWLHQYNLQINHCLSCGKYYDNVGFD